VRLSTGGGWRRTCVGRERRWPSFTTWRWAGRALDGWIRCRWITPLLQRPRPQNRCSMTVTSRRRAQELLAPGERRPRRRAGERRRRLPGRRGDRRSVRLARALERVRRLLVKPDGQPSVPLARAPERVPRLLVVRRLPVRPVVQPSVRHARALGRVRRLLVRPDAQPGVPLARAPERAAGQLSREPPVGPVRQRS
jgi:hypothetical protein